MTTQIIPGVGTTGTLPSSSLENAYVRAVTNVETAHRLIEQATEAGADEERMACLARLLSCAQEEEEAARMRL